MRLYRQMHADTGIATDIDRHGPRWQDGASHRQVVQTVVRRENHRVKH